MANKDASKVIQKVQDLIALAKDSDSNEARNAAMQAVKLMDEHKLVVIPATDLERAKKIVEGAQALVAKMKEESNQKAMMFAAAAFFLGKKF